MRPGIYHNLPETEYFGGPGVSNTMLGDMRPPARCYALHIDPDRPKKADKPGQLEGKLAHCAMLEPDELRKRYVIGPTIHRGNKEWKKFVADNPDRIAIQQAQYDVARWQAESVHRLTEIRPLLDALRTEVSAYWEDDSTGELCRCRADMVSHYYRSGVVLLDIKTYYSSDPDEFEAQISRKNYHRQAAFYSDGYARAAKTNVLAFVFVSVPSQYPFIASCHMLDDESIDQGRIDYRNSLNSFHECMVTGSWPDYSDTIHIARIKNWKFDK